MNRFLSYSALSLGVFGVTGCSAPVSFSLGESTKGEQGKATFSYETGFLSDADDADCLFGCPVDMAVVPGSKHDIDIDDAPTAASVDTSNAAVARLTFQQTCDCERETSDSLETMPKGSAACEAGFALVCRDGATFEAGAPGEASLVVLDAKGVVIDRTTLRVAAPVRAELRAFHTDEAELPSPRISLNAETASLLAAEFFGASGERLRTSQAVDWSVDDPAVLQFSAWFTSNPTTHAGRIVSLTPKAVGKTTVHAKVGDVETTIAVEVTP